MNSPATVRLRQPLFEHGQSASIAADDEEVREFEALLRDIAELRDPDTVVEHMGVDVYRKGKRT